MFLRSCEPEDAGGEGRRHALTSPEGGHYKESHMSRRRKIAAALVLFLPLFSSAVAVRDWRGERMLSQAEAEKRRGNVNGATLLYERALGLGKDRAALELARMALYRRDWAAVERYGRRAAALNPLEGHARVLLAYGRAAARGSEHRGGLEDVLDECRRAVALSPAEETVWRACADLTATLYLQGDGEWRETEEGRGLRREAVDAYRAALRFDGGAATLRSAVAAHPAVDFIMDVIEGESPPVIAKTVGLMIAEGLWDEAKGEFWERAFASPSPVDYTRAAMEALGRHGRHEEACSAAASHLDLFPGDGEIAFLGAGAGMRAGRRSAASERAGTLYRMATEAEPGNALYRRAYGGYLYGRGDLAEARRQLQEAVQLDGGDAEGWYRLGTVMERQEGREAALPSYRRALSLEPRNRRYRRAVMGGS